MYRCRVETDSVSPRGKRAISFVITFPRVVLAEAVTHRKNRDTWNDDVSWCERAATEDISKNSASSRAIPVKRMLADVCDDPYMPRWTLAQKGMQGAHTDDAAVIEAANALWLRHRDHALFTTEALLELQIHKGDCNRVLEPWAWVTQVVTSSNWDNFFALRCHHMAHPALRHIARMMFLARRRSTPVALDYGQWHLPFVPREEAQGLTWQPNPGERFGGRSDSGVSDLVRTSVARCAWVSYANHDRDATLEAVDNTWNRLFAETPAAGGARADCFDAETEVLTGAGWRRWPRVTGEDTLATLSPVGAIEYHQPTRLLTNSRRGDLYRVRSEHVDLLVTPGHRLLASRRTKDGFTSWGLVPVEELTEASHKLTLTGGLWAGQGDLPEGWGEVLGFFIGDGSYNDASYSATFHLRKRRKIDWLHAAAERAGFRVHDRPRDHYYLSCPREYKLLLSACYDGARQKVIPVPVLGMGQQTLRGVLAGLVASDGHAAASGKITFSTTSPTLLGQFQELALKCGGCAAVRLDSDAQVSAWGGPAKPCYSACLFRERKSLARIGWTRADRARQVAREGYDGLVYSASVPNGVVYVRRNGKACWCGDGSTPCMATRFTPPARGWAAGRRGPGLPEPGMGPSAVCPGPAALAG